MLNESIKAILFDKDGTLIDFHHTWHPVFIGFINAVADHGKLDAETRLALMAAQGGDETGFHPNSAFANAPFSEILDMIRRFVPGFGEDDMRSAFEGVIAGHSFDAVPIGDGKRSLEVLKERGYIIGVATADRKKSTEHTLSKAGILELFDYIGADDTVENGKPARDLMDQFCSIHGFTPDQVAMVGDSLRDMEFAQNSGAGQAIFVRSSFPDPAAEAIATTILDDINQLV